MKLLRYGPPGQEKPGLLDAAGTIRDLSGVLPDFSGDALSAAGLAKLAALDTASLPAVSGNPRLGPPVAHMKNFVCIGLNYADHAAETGAAIPKEPIIFLKSLSALCGPNDDVEIPRNSQKTDWEVELAIVIGTKAKNISEAEALDYVAGYAVCNDVSEREFQIERGGQWDKGKSCETFNPLGPWVATADEVPDPQALGMRLSVNGEIRQDGTSANQIFGVHHVVWYLSQFMVLRPGDLINTGTPAGVALGLPGEPYLRDGDVVELSIDGLGTARQTFRGQA